MSSLVSASLEKQTWLSNEGQQQLPTELKGVERFVERLRSQLQQMSKFEQLSTVSIGGIAEIGNHFECGRV